MPGYKDFLQATPSTPTKEFTAELLDLKKDEAKSRLQQLIDNGLINEVHNEIYGQLKELVKGYNPSYRFSEELYKELIEKHLGDIDIDDYGIWAYYPWNKKLIHILDEEEFKEVRTNRNQYKITKKERDILAEKKIGIIGLSVGQSIALTLSMERGYGELRLADFDSLELSNLNRIRAGVHNLGVPKIIITAREIAEIDPYLKITCFFDGLTEENIDDFFTEGGNLDLLVDECDGLDMKIISRYKAKELGIPVLMDTSDRGMLDVERFDLEPDRPILHGTTEGVNPQNIKGLSNEDKIPVILQMLGVDNLSLRAKASMIEVEQTINTWPQLASSVALGGAVGTDIARRILLDQFHASGRFYIDLEEIIPNKNSDEPQKNWNVPFEPLKVERMEQVVDALGLPEVEEVSGSTVKTLVNSACWAPSTGNDQPWKWLYKGGRLFLFHDRFRSYSFGDFMRLASFISFGAAYENLRLEANCQNLETELSFSDDLNTGLVAVISFKKSQAELPIITRKLCSAIHVRHTNRNPGKNTAIPNETLDALKNSAEEVEGASLKWFTDAGDIKELGEIIGACDRTRLLNPQGHHDFVHHEMRWTTEDARNTGDGIDIKTLGLSNSQLAALGVIKNEKVLETLNKLGGGYGLDMLAKKNLSTASALCMITFPKFELRSYFEGGRAMERFWLTATNYDIAVYPVISPFYIFPRVTHGNGEGLEEKNVLELKELRKRFEKLSGVNNDMAEVFLAKVSYAEKPDVKSYRLPIDDVLYFG